MAYRAEYIWVDGSVPTAEVRSKTRVLADGEDPGIWGFDGSSTNQAEGSDSDVVLKPVFTCPDPLRGGDNIMVMSETFLPETMEPHPTNMRAQTRALLDKYGDQEFWFGLEQEYTMLDPVTKWPSGFPPTASPARRGRTTAGWVRCASTGARWWSSTPTGASAQVWRSRGPTPR